jgi:hypothetical protein
MYFGNDQLPLVLQRIDMVAGGLKRQLRWINDPVSKTMEP